MVEFGTSSAFRGWVRVRVLCYGFGVRGRKVKSRDCTLTSDLVRALRVPLLTLGPSHFTCKQVEPESPEEQGNAGLNSFQIVFRLMNKE